MPPDVSPHVLRQILGEFASGVTVVTTRHRGEVHGTTMSAFSSVSLNPPLVLVCIDRSSEIHDMVASSAIFAVNILHEGQADIAQALSLKGTPELNAAHKLVSLPFHTVETGAPVLDDHLAFLDCRVENAVEAGDHTVYIGRIVEGGAGNVDAGALLHFRGQYGAMSDGS